MASVSVDSAASPVASTIRIAMRSAISSRSSALGWEPISNVTPTSSACALPVGSSRVTLPSSSRTIRRAPQSTAVTRSTLPPRQCAILVVPPPISTLSVSPSLLEDRMTAPEPWAAMVASSPSPALTATNFPASAENRSPIARALRRRTATPVRIRAPVSTSERAMPALLKLFSINSPRASASISAPLV